MRLRAGGVAPRRVTLWDTELLPHPSRAFVPAVHGARRLVETHLIIPAGPLTHPRSPFSTSLCLSPFLLLTHLFSIPEHIWPKVLWEASLLVKPTFNGESEFTGILCKQFSLLWQKLYFRCSWLNFNVTSLARRWKKFSRGGELSFSLLYK